MKDYWWIETGVPEDEANSGCVRVSLSSTDAVGYIGKMCNLSRATVGKSIKRLADVNVIWIVQEGPERVRHSKLEARKYFKKHFLIVGLSFEVSERG